MLKKTINYLAILCFFISINAEQEISYIDLYGMQSDNLFFDVKQYGIAFKLLNTLDNALYTTADNRFYTLAPFENAYTAIDTLADIESNNFIQYKIISEKEIPQAWQSYPLIAFILSQLNFEITDDMQRIDKHIDLLSPNLNLPTKLKKQIAYYETYNTLNKMQLMMLSFIIAPSNGYRLITNDLKSQSKFFNLGNVIDIMVIQLLIFTKEKSLKDKIALLNNHNNLRDKMNLNNPLYYINFQLYNWHKLMNKLIYRLIDLGLIIYEL